MNRHIYVGTKVWPEGNVVKDCCYVHIEENGELWAVDVERMRSNLVVNKTIEDLIEYFDQWTDLGTISDGVRIGDVLGVSRRITLI